MPRKPAPKHGRETGAGQESTGGGQFPEETFQTPSGGAIPHEGRGPKQPQRPGRSEPADDADAEKDIGNPW